MAVWHTLSASLYAYLYACLSFFFLLVTFPSDCHMNYLQTRRKEWNAHFLQLGCFVRCWIVLCSFKDSASWWMHAKRRAVRFRINKACLEVSDLSCRRSELKGQNASMIAGTFSQNEVWSGTPYISPSLETTFTCEAAIQGCDVREGTDKEFGTWFICRVIQWQVVCWEFVSVTAQS